MKVCISNTRFCFYLAFYLYVEMDFGVHGYAVVRIRGLVFFGWCRLRGPFILKRIKRTSSSAPPMEKHDILHSRIKIWLWLVWRGFYGVIVMTNVQSALYSLCERALNARAQISLLTRGWTTSDFFKSTFMWWKSSRSRLVADDVINEQISLKLWQTPCAQLFLSYFTEKSQNSVDNTFLYWMILCVRSALDVLFALLSVAYVSAL